MLWEFEVTVIVLITNENDAWNKVVSGKVHTFPFAPGSGHVERDDSLFIQCTCGCRSNGDEFVVLEMQSVLVDWDQKLA